MSKERKMSLAGIRTEKRNKPDRILIYGVEGIGKTEWAAYAPHPLFIAAEDGVEHLMGETGPKIAVWDDPHPETWEEVLECVRTLIDDDHEYKTLVIDTLDWLEPLVKEYVIENTRDAKSGRQWTASDYEAYGRGSELAAGEFRKLIVLLERLQREKNMTMILVAHSDQKLFNNPAGEDYVRFQLKLTGKKSPAIFKEWCHSVLFANYDDHVRKGSRKGRDRGRVLYTSRTAAWDAKNRYGLPPQIELDFEEYTELRDADVPPAFTALKDEIAELRGQLEVDAATAKKIDAWIKKAGDDPAKLRKVARQLRERVPQEQED